MSFGTICEGPRLMSATNSTLAAFAIAAATVVTSAIPAGVLSQNIGGALSATLQVVAVGSDGHTINFRVLIRTSILGADGNPSGNYLVRCVGQGVATLGALTVTLNGVTMRYADTITFTPATSATTMKGSQSAFASARAEDPGTPYSPADDTVAEVQINSLCRNGDLLLDFERGSATSVNAILELAKV